jgi:hypothetical protein
MAVQVPRDILQLDSFLVGLAGKRTFHAGVLRMEPNTCYNWHVDTDRKVGLNMLLSDDGDSRCLFLDGEPGVVFKTQELQYEPDTYYVFKTQVPHTVLNTEDPRYLFSLEFLEEENKLVIEIKFLSTIREKMARTASQAMAQARETKEELKVKELLILDLTKK